MNLLPLIFFSASVAVSILGLVDFGYALTASESSVWIVALVGEGTAVRQMAKRLVIWKLGNKIRLKMTNILSILPRILVHVIYEFNYIIHLVKQLVISKWAFKD